MATGLTAETLSNIGESNLVKESLQSPAMYMNKEQSAAGEETTEPYTSPENSIMVSQMSQASVDEEQTATVEQKTHTSNDNDDPTIDTPAPPSSSTRQEQNSESPRTNPSTPDKHNAEQSMFTDRSAIVRNVSPQPASIGQMPQQSESMQVLATDQQTSQPSISTGKPIVVDHRLDSSRANQPPVVSRTTVQLFLTFIYMLNQRHWDISNTWGGNFMTFFLKLDETHIFPPFPQASVRHYTHKSKFMRIFQERMLALDRQQWENKKTRKEKGQWKEPTFVEGYDETHPRFDDLTIPFYGWVWREDREAEAWDRVMGKSSLELKQEKSLARFSGRAFPKSSRRFRDLKRTAKSFENFLKLAKEIRNDLNLELGITGTEEVPNWIFAPQQTLSPSSVRQGHSKASRKDRGEPKKGADSMVTNTAIANSPPKTALQALNSEGSDQNDTEMGEGDSEEVAETEMADEGLENSADTEMGTTKLPSSPLEAVRAEVSVQDKKNDTEMEDEIWDNGVDTEMAHPKLPSPTPEEAPPTVSIREIRHGESGLDDGDADIGADVQVLDAKVVSPPHQATFSAHSSEDGKDKGTEKEDGGSENGADTGVVEDKMATPSPSTRSDRLIKTSNAASIEPPPPVGQIEVGSKGETAKTVSPVVTPAVKIVLKHSKSPPSSPKENKAGASQQKKPAAVQKTKGSSNKHSTADDEYVPEGSRKRQKK